MDLSLWSYLPLAIYLSKAINLASQLSTNAPLYPQQQQQQQQDSKQPFLLSRFPSSERSHYQ